MTETSPAPKAPPTEIDVDEFLRRAQEYGQEQARQAAIRWGAKYGIDPGAKPRTLSQWAMGVVRECPHKYMLAQILKIRTRMRKSSLAFGSAMDEAVNARLGITGSLHSAQVAFLSYWDREVEEADGMMQTPESWDLNDFRLAGQSLVNAMEPVLDQIKPVYSQKWLDWVPIVDPITGEAVPGFSFAGKLDIVDMVQLEGMDEPVACVTDAKALATLTKPADHYLVTKLSTQLVSYAYGATQDELLSDLPGIGTMVGYLEGQRKKPPAPPKLNKDGTPSKRKPAEPPKVQRTFADVTAQDFRELFILASALARQIQGYVDNEARGMELHEAWPRNFSACNRDAYGQPCDYRALCRSSLFAEHPGLDEVYEYERKPSAAASWT